jgi:hypothetical protein
MDWEHFLKNNPSLSSKTKPTMRTKLRPVPTKPQDTCLKRFNAIVDYILEEVNRIERGSAPLWNTGQGNNTMRNHGWYNIWTYYFLEEKDYRRDDYFSKALINSEHDCGYAENEDDACYHLKTLSKASVSPQRQLRETAQDPLPQLEYSIHINTFHMDDKDPIQTIHEDGRVTGGPRTGAIQCSVDVIDINRHPYALFLRDMDDTTIIPTITRLLKEHDEMFKRVLQMAKDAVSDLKL